MGFFDSKTKSKVALAPASGTEKEIRKYLKQQIKDLGPLSGQLIRNSLQQQDFTTQLYQRMLDEQNALDAAISPQERAEIEASRIRGVQGLGLTQDQILQSALQQIQQGASLTPEQQARIQQSADLAIQSGLSDLGKFRDDTLLQLRQSSASRGLRPSDTPIVDQFNRFGEESSRQAEQLVRQIRQQQAQQELQYPLQAGQLNLAQIGAAGDLAAQRRQFEALLNEQANQNRLNFGAGLQNQGLGLLNSQDPVRVFGSLLGLRSAGATTTNANIASGYQQAQAIGGALQGAAGFLALSDERAKTDVAPLDSRTVLRAIRPVRYRYREELGIPGEQAGVMAQDLQQAGLGLAVLDLEEEDGYLRVDPTKLVLPTLGLLADVSQRLEAIEGLGLAR